MGEFAHLHVHTEYSILKGVGEVSRWYEVATERSITSIAITEDGNMASAMASYMAAKDNDDKVKCIFGTQIDVVDDVSTDIRGEPIVLLAQTERGYKNLLYLHKYGWSKGLNTKFGRPRVSWPALKKWNADVYALTGSLTGPIAVSSEAGYVPALKVAKRLHKIYGDNLRFEVQLSDDPRQPAYNRVLLRLSKQLGVKCVLTSDCHYHSPNRAKLADVLPKIAPGGHKRVDLQPVDRTKWLMGIEDLERQRASKHSYVTQLMFDELVHNTLECAANCNVELEIGKHSLPVYDRTSHELNTDDMKNNADLFLAIAKEGFRERIGRNKKKRKRIDEYRKRFKYEYGVIKKANFIDYFLIVEDIIRWCRNNDIAVGAARGSVAGSLVAYCMKITDIDPFEFDLMFERFLNPTRISGERAKSADALPDIDLDFEKVRRPDVKQYLVDKYGADRVCTITTYQTMKLKSLIRDLHRAFGGDLPVDEDSVALFDIRKLNKLCSSLEDEKIEDLKQAKKKSKLFKSFYADYPYFVDYYCEGLEDQVKAPSRHAAAVLITPTKLTDWVPIRSQNVQDEGRVTVTQWEDIYCERRGLLKLDVLGIKTLNVFKTCARLVEERHDKQIVLATDKINLHEHEVLAEFNKGATEGVFQFNSRLQSSFLSRLDHVVLEDLITANAVLRPGPMDADAHNKFIDLKAGNMTPEYDHAMLEEYLHRTYGLYIYQEDVMRTANVLGQLSLSEADVMRTAMKKHDKAMMDEFRAKFIDGAVKNGLDAMRAIGVWEKLLAFFAYGFNRCLVGDTLVLTASGEYVRISTLYKRHCAGAEIWLKSWDKESGTVVDHKVGAVYKNGKRNVARLSLRSGNSVTLTSRHGVATKRGFRIAKDLRADDDILFLPDGSDSLDASVMKLDRCHYDDNVPVTTYDISMAGEPRNYFANGFLVHNSHSASYAVTGYYCQWLKVHYPLEFWAATLEHAHVDEKKNENIWTFRKHIQQIGIEFEPPAATRPTAEFSIEGDRIAWPVKAIKGIGVKTADAIATSCKESSPKTLREFFDCVPKRNVNKKAFDLMIAAGAMDCFGKPHEVAEEYYRSLRKDKEVPEKFRESPSNTEHWTMMKEAALGYMSEPLRVRYSSWFHEQVSSMAAVARAPDGEVMIAGGMVRRVHPHPGRNGGMMYFIDVEDKDGSFLLFVSPKFSDRNEVYVRVGDLVEVVGRKGTSNRNEPEIVLDGGSNSEMAVMHRE